MKIQKISMFLVCVLMLGVSSFLYITKLDRTLETEEILVGDVLSYRYDSNGYVGLDITLNTLKTGTSEASNNTKKLQDAMNKVSDAGGGYVYLPSGTYYFGQGGYNSSNDKEDFAIKCRNNVHLKGKGTNENSSSYTVLKPYYNSPTADGGMDMFYFNNYKDTGFQSTSYNTSSSTDVSYVDTNGNTITWKNQTIYLVNADFSDFVIDGDSARGGIASAGGHYRTDGKGFMINLFADCDWDNVVVKNVDATGFGVDCPINSTIKNSKAINCGKAAVQSSEGASGFGIGTGYSNEESLHIENCIAINNKKFGYFFEHQARFSNTNYKATTSKGFVVSNCISGGNMYDYGGLKAYDVSYENNTSVSNLSTYTVSGLKATNTSGGTYNYTPLTFSNGKVKLRENVQPIFFSRYTSNNVVTNVNVFEMLTDVKNYTNEIKWAVNSGIVPVSSATKFNPSAKVTRMDVVKTLYALSGRELDVSTVVTSADVSNYQNIIASIGFTDLGNSYQYELDSVVWAYNKGIVSKDTKFNPSDNCTRAQLVTMLYRLAGSPSVSENPYFSDVEVGSWYYDAVSWGLLNGVVQGVSNERFDPNDEITKEQLAIFLYRFKYVLNNKYKIKTNVIGGTNNNATSYIVGTRYTLRNPSRNGYTFKGWTGSNGTTPSKNVTIDSNGGNLTYTANWTPNLLAVFIKNDAKKKTYTVGDSLDISGLVVAAKYGDNNIYDISNYEVSPKVLNTVGQQTITIKYGGISTSYSVNVNDKNISKISIVNEPTKKEYFVGENIDTTGLKVKVTYTNSSSSEITSGFSISPAKVTAAGTNKVVVKYGDKSANFNVTGKEVELTKVEIENKPVRVNYYVGEFVEYDGLKLKLTYNNNDTKIIENGFTTKAVKLDSTGEKTISVTYGGKTVTFKVNVSDVKVTGIKIEELPKKVNYIIGDKFDSTGLKIYILKNNGYKELINDGYTLSIKENEVINNNGVIPVTVTYKEYSGVFNINVYDKNQMFLTISNRPTKTNYVVGDSFDTAGLKVEVVNGDGKKEEVKDYSISISNGTVLAGEGTHNVVVQYNGMSVNFNINVVKIVNVSVRPDYKKEYKVGETFDDKTVVIVEYSDGIKEEIAKDYVVNVDGGLVFETLGEKNVTITYGNVSTMIKINVLDNEKSNLWLFITLGICGVIGVIIGILIIIVIKSSKKRKVTINNM